LKLTYDVVDEDGDGTVIVGMNTYMLGRSDLDLATALEGSAVTNRDNARDIIADSAVKAIDADTVSDVDIQQTDPVRSPPLDPTSYEMNITNIDDKTKELAVGTLQITQPNVDNTTTWTAPENVWDDLEDGEDHEPGQVYELIEEGKLTQQSSAAEEDVIVYEFETTGIFGALELSQGLLDDLGEDDDYSDALIALLDDDDTRGEIPSGTGTFGATPGGSSQLSQNWFFEDFSVRMTQENPQANRQPIEVDLRTTNNNDGLKVISDWRNESLFVAVDTAEAEGERVDSFTGLQNVDDTASDNLAIESPQRYSGNFSVSGGDQADPVSSRSNMTDGDTVTIRNDIKLTSKSIDFDTDQSGVIRASAETDQPITGTTTVAPGTELDLRIKSTGQTPFLENPRATVQEDRSFEGLVDFSDRASNTTFEATARGFDDDPTPGVIGEAPTATVTFNDQNQEDGTVTVNSATLSEGGYLVVHADDDGSPGDVLGNSEYLSAGEHFDVEVDVGTLSEEQTLHAMAHQDDGDESYNFPDADGPYTLNGTAVFDSATVSLQDESTTTEKVTTTEETTTEGTTEATTEGGETTEDESGGDGPGFTAIFALVALLGAGLLAARRHN
jgi:PGF-CTERM protein